MRTVLTLLLLAMLLPALPVGQIATANQPLVLTHVTVIDMTGAQPKPDMTVVITGNRITALGRNSEVSVPQNSRIVDGTGKFLIPGLWDMHAHTVYGRTEDTEKTFLPLFIANGITGIRNPGSINSLEQINRWRKAKAVGKLIAPLIIVGQQVDGTGGINVSFVYRVKTEAEARAAVRRIKEEGFDFVKPHSRLSRETFFAAADEAKRLGIPFAGHVPLAVNDGEASDAGLKSIEHLEGMLVSTSSDEARIRREWMDYETRIAALNGRPVPPELEEQLFRFIAECLNTFDAEKAARLYALFVKNGTYHCPTLVIHRAWGSLANPSVFNDSHLRYVPVRQRQSVNTYLDAARTWPAERKAVVERLCPKSRCCPKSVTRLKDLARTFRVNRAFRRLFGQSLVERLYQFRLRMVREMHRAGVEMLAGTDTAYGYPVAGFALHDELGLFVQAGLTPMEALRTATYNPAKYLGLLDTLGTVERDKLADLVLLEANPLEDIGNTRRVNAVIVNGQYIPKEGIAKLLTDIEAAASSR